MRFESDEQSIGLGWPAFWAKTVGTFIWLIACVIAAAASASPVTGLGKRLLSMLLMIVPSLVLLAIVSRRTRTQGEFERSVSLASWGSAALWNILFGQVFVGMIFILSSFTGDSFDLARLGYIMLFVQPPGVVLYGTCKSQWSRWNYGRRGRA